MPVEGETFRAPKKPRKGGRLRRAYFKTEPLIAATICSAIVKGFQSTYSQNPQSWWPALAVGGVVFLGMRSQALTLCGRLVIIRFLNWLGFLPKGYYEWLLDAAAQAFVDRVKE